MLLFLLWLLVLNDFYDTHGQKVEQPNRHKYEAYSHIVNLLRVHQQHTKYHEQDSLSEVNEWAGLAKCFDEEDGWYS